MSDKGEISTSLRAPPFDGHTSADVVDRLRGWNFRQEQAA